MPTENSSSVAQVVRRLLARVSPLGRLDRYDTGAFDRAMAHARLPLDRAYLRRHGFLGEIGRLAERTAGKVAPGADAPRVLVLALRSWTSHTAYESVLAQALRARGADVAMLTCGGGMPICEVGYARRAMPRPCDRCGWFTDQVRNAAGVRSFRLADTLPWGSDGRRAPLAPPAGGAVDPAWAASISAPWFVKSSEPASTPHGAEVQNDFEVAVAGVERAIDGVLDDFEPDVVVMISGLFAAERTIRQRALARGARVTTYEIAPRANALVFSHDAPAPMYDTAGAWAALRSTPLTPDQQSAIEKLMDDRARGVGAHEKYFDAVATDAASLRRELEVPAGRLLSLFTNITWDSAALDRDVGFDSMTDFIVAAALATEAAGDATLVIRMHPGEVRWGTSQDIAALVRERLRGRVSRIRFIPAAQPLDSYALMHASDLVLTYASTIGMEAAVRGIPVAVGGDTHYRNSGFTLDVENAKHLARIIDAGGGMSDDEVDLAWRYAYAFFFRLMLPMPPVQATSTHPSRVADDPGELAPGADPYVDFVCDAILTGSPFVLPEALVTHGP